MTRSKKGFSKKLPQRFLQRAIVKFLRKNSKKKYSAKALSHKLKIKNSKDSISTALELLKTKGLVLGFSEGRYGINTGYVGRSERRNKKLISGRIDMTYSGAGYVLTDRDRDIYVPKKYLNGALHQDTVLVSAEYSNGHRPRGKVVEVIDRFRTSFIGIFRDFKNYGFVFVDDRKESFEIKILPDSFNGAEDGDVVIVKVDDFGMNRNRQLIGHITSILNTTSENDYRMTSILINKGFHIEFPKEVMDYCDNVDVTIREDDIRGREEFRDVLTFTIDPDDAKDFDDAISMRYFDDGNIEFGVHIADVSHYVKEGSELDREAYKRSTSVYLADRVCPMLPEKLSNQLCSLRPGEDKLTFSAIFVVTPENEVIDFRYAKTIIHSDRRFTYNEVQDILDRKEGLHYEELNRCNAFAIHLRSQRIEKGSINFESSEVIFSLDENGSPVGISKKERKDSHMLVEEFMLLANRYVAKSIGTSKETWPHAFVYRIHDRPDPEKLVELALLASEFDIKLNLDTPSQIAGSLNKMTSDHASTNVLDILSPLAIRCMAKAAYSTENIGHFGLGFEHYTHFTSPIRRYSDVLVHRVLEKIIDSQKEYGIKDLEHQCKHISTKERSAIEAERESVKYKQVEYLQGHEGEIFEGMIRSIIDRGLFIELKDSGIDGMVSYDKMGESFIIHPARIKAVGSVTRQIIRLGDTKMVRLIEANLDNLQVELELVTVDR